jgi:hypothetical protein
MASIEASPGMKDAYSDELQKFHFDLISTFPL